MAKLGPSFFAWGCPQSHVTSQNKHIHRLWGTTKETQRRVFAQLRALRRTSVQSPTAGQAHPQKMPRPNNLAAIQITKPNLAKQSSLLRTCSQQGGKNNAHTLARTKAIQWVTSRKDTPMGRKQALWVASNKIDKLRLLKQATSGCHLRNKPVCSHGLSDSADRLVLTDPEKSKANFPMESAAHTGCS
jgi:hypothetical protein